MFRFPFCYKKIFFNTPSSALDRGVGREGGDEAAEDPGPPSLTGRLQAAHSLGSGTLCDKRITFSWAVKMPVLREGGKRSCVFPAWGPAVLSSLRLDTGDGLNYHRADRCPLMFRWCAGVWAAQGARLPRPPAVAVMERQPRAGPRGEGMWTPLSWSPDVWAANP